MFVLNAYLCRELRFVAILPFKLRFLLRNTGVDSEFLRKKLAAGGSAPRPVGTLPVGRGGFPALPRPAGREGVPRPSPPRSTNRVLPRPVKKKLPRPSLFGRLMLYQVVIGSIALQETKLWRSCGEFKKKRGEWYRQTDQGEKNWEYWGRNHWGKDQEGERSKIMGELHDGRHDCRDSQQEGTVSEKFLGANCSLKSDTL